MSGRYQAYPEYKESGVEWIGEIPPSWKILRGKFMFREISERSEQGSETLLSVSEYYGVKPRGEVVEEGDFLSRAESLEGYKKCQVNDLVMNIMLAWKRGLGVSKFEGIVSPAYSVFRFFESANPDYMHYLLRTDLYTGHFKTRSTGVIDSRLRLYPDSFFDTSLIVPPLPEQTHIAAFLDHETAKIDRLIEKQQSLISLLKEKRQAVISHAVTQGLNPHAPLKESGIEWLGQVPEHWIAVPLKRFISTRKGAPFKATDFTDAGIKVVRASDIKELGINTPTTYLPAMFLKSHPRAILRAGELILSTVGSGPQVRNSAVGQIGRVPSDLDGTLLNQNTVVFRVIDKQVLEPFLFHLVRANGYRDHLDLHAHGTANQASLNVDDMLSFHVPIPPADEQADIVGFIDHVDLNMEKLEGAAATQVTLLQERRTALISAAVTGKIDVRAWQPPVVSELETTEAVTA